MDGILVTILHGIAYFNSKTFYQLHDVFFSSVNMALVLMVDMV